MDISLQINTNQLLKAYHLVPERLAVELKDGLDHASLKFLKEFRKRRLQGPPGVKSRGRGGLFWHFKRNPVYFRGKQALDSYVEIFTESKIAKLHEEGGTVRDPSGGSLAVPLQARTQMFTSTGALRKTYKNVKALKNVFPKKINGKVFLVRSKKKDNSILPLFVLKKSVRIKPRLGFVATFEAVAGDMFKILNRSFDRALDDAWRR
jgi:hypothetical protein